MDPYSHDFVALFDPNGIVSTIQCLVSSTVDQLATFLGVEKQPHVAWFCGFGLVPHEENMVHPTFRGQ